MQSEEEQVQDIMRDIHEGDVINDRLKYDPRTRTIRPVGPYEDPRDVIVVTPRDMEHFGVLPRRPAIIVISSDLLAADSGEDRSRDLRLRVWDDGEVYNALAESTASDTVPGTLYVTNDGATVERVGKADDHVRVVACRKPALKRDGYEHRSTQEEFDIKGFVLRDGAWLASEVECVSLERELHSRVGGLIETDVLGKKCATVGGLGSGGAPAALELAKAGVGHFRLVDYDRLEVCNVCRHVAGVSQVGRYKTRALRQAILEKNPRAEVQTWERKIGWDNIDWVRQVVRGSDLVIGGTDDSDGRLVLNRVCVEEGISYIVASAYERAFGGQIVRVRPKRGPCFQCVRMSLPSYGYGQEISSRAHAQRIAYADREVAIEPGLSIDIAPISIMVAKLALQELLHDIPTTLRSLDEDLIAPWYIWINRREPGTEFEKMIPLGFGVRGMRILRWYGIDLERRPDCPCCGDFVTYACQEQGIRVTPDDLGLFSQLGGTEAACSAKPIA